MDNTQKSRILVVDDDPLNILILEEILGKEYDLTGVSTGDEAIRMAEELRPDLILLDIMMPGADGFEICRKLRTNKNLKFTKIILVSAKSLLKDRLEGYKAGADDYISKPFDPDELLAKVRIFIRLKSVEEIEQVKDDLINVFSHETRTPLNAVLGFAKFLKESPNLSEEEKEGVDFIIESALNLLELANKTILLQSLRKGNRELSLSECMVDEIIRGALHGLSTLAEKKQIKVESRFPRDLCFKVDQELIENCVYFLLNNAMKFSPENSIVEVAAGVDQATKEGYIKVKDYGKGIPEDYLKVIFDEFAVEDVAHHGRGHGLSLSIVKYIMDMHKGKVKAQNSEDTTGAEFTLIFPPESVIKS